MHEIENSHHRPLSTTYSTQLSFFFKFNKKLDVTIRMMEEMYTLFCNCVSYFDFFFFFQRLVVLGIVADFSYCESEPEPSDATSRIRIVKYQPAIVTKIPIYSSNGDNVVSPGEYRRNLAQKPLDRKQDTSSELESQEASVSHQIFNFLMKNIQNFLIF